MRPEFVVLIKDQTDRVTSSYLFYSERKAIRAHRDFQDLSADGSRTIVLEDGRSAKVAMAVDLRCQVRVVRAISTYLPRRQSFLQASREQLDGFAAAFHVPPEAMYEIARLERQYCDNAGGAMWEAFKRAYLPTPVLRWIQNRSMTPATMAKLAMAFCLLIAVLGWEYIEHHPACKANCSTDISAQRR